MRTYVLISGLIFLLVLIAHIARIAAEGAGTLRDPVFLASSLIAAGLAFWSATIFRRICA